MAQTEKMLIKAKWYRRMKFSGGPIQYGVPNNSAVAILERMLFPDRTVTLQSHLVVDWSQASKSSPFPKAVRVGLTGSLAGQQGASEMVVTPPPRG